MSSKTLLFADDSATMRSIMEKTFQGEDFAVVTVPSGQAAIEKAKELSPDIIVADAGMTGVSGYDVCDAVKKDQFLNATPVMIMSGISNPYDDVRGKNVNVTEHIKKPFDTTKLIDRVKELCLAAPEKTEVRSSGPGVAPARPNFNRPPVPKRDALHDMPSSNATLHAFPRPGLIEEAVQPVVHPPTESKADYVTQSRSGAPPEPAAREETTPRIMMEPEPIELAEEENGNEIQVGTLAELAQMNELGGKVPQEIRHDAIELEANTASPSIEDTAVPTSYAPPPAAQQQIQSAVSGAAAHIVNHVEGLTTEQANAIMALTEDVVEKIVWEVVPDLAEAIIREKLDELLKK